MTKALQTGGHLPAPDSIQASRLRLKLRQTFAALKYPNYRLWFTGQLVSLVGTWMQSTALSYFVYDLTKSPEYLGYIGFAGGIPTWLFMLYGGIIADRISRRTLLVITQSAMMVLAFVLAALTFTGMVRPWQLLIMAFLLGTANAFDAPARLAFVPELIPHEDLTNAIALNGTMFNLATAFGPAVAGITYAFFGPQWCFTINGLSFIAVIIALLKMKLDPWEPRPNRATGLQNMVTGIRFVVNNVTVRTLIIGIGMVSLFGLGFVVLIPAWAVSILGGDQPPLGCSNPPVALALIGALSIASLGRFQYKGRLLTLGSFIFPVLVIVFAAMRWLPASLLVMAGVGWAFMFVVNLTNALVQIQVPDELRGRVMSVYSMSFFGLMPIGALLAGKSAGLYGETITVIFCALVMLAYASLVYLRFPSIRKLN